MNQSLKETLPLTKTLLNTVSNEHKGNKQFIEGKDSIFYAYSIRGTGSIKYKGGAIYNGDLKQGLMQGKG